MPSTAARLSCRKVTSLRRRLLTALRPQIAPYVTRAAIVDQLEQSVADSLSVEDGWEHDTGDGFPDERREIAELDSDTVEIDLLCSVWMVQRMDDRQPFFVDVGGATVQCNVRRKTGGVLVWDVEISDF
jgi:hypothetical protein